MSECRIWYERDGHRILIVSEDGVVRIEAEALRNLMIDAGFRQLTYAELKAWAERRPEKKDVATMMLRPEDDDGELRPSSAWCIITGIRVLDPDGWDRTNFKESWSEPISREEFMRRANESTIGHMG